MSADRHIAEEIKRALTDVKGVCDALGLTAKGGRSVLRQASGLIVLCVWHEEKTPSLSVRRAADGTIAVKCHGCQHGDDVLGLIAGARGLSMRGKDFGQVLAEGARLAGLWGLVDEIEGRSPIRPSAPEASRATTFAQAAPTETRTYPDGAERFWGILEPLSADPEVCEYLRLRAIDPGLVEGNDLARVIGPRTPIPPWTVCRGGDWPDAGYRLIVPMYDANGKVQSVRGWRVGGNEELPKRLPPYGHKASELVMLDTFGVAWMSGARSPSRVVIAEGEPDFLTWAVRMNDPSSALMGIISGSWSKAIADKFPVACRVDVRTDRDQAGDRYFNEIEQSLRRRCFIYRAAKGTS